MKFPVNLFCAYVFMVGFSGCIEEEVEFVDLKMPGELLLASETPISNVHWYQSSVGYTTTDHYGKTELRLIDVITKKEKIIEYSHFMYPVQNQSWIRDNTWYGEAWIKNKKVFFKSPLTGTPTGQFKELGDRIPNPVLHQNKYFVSLGPDSYVLSYDSIHLIYLSDSLGGLPFYLVNEETGIEEKIGFGFPTALSPDGSTVLFFNQKKDQKESYHFLDLPTKVITDVDFDFPHLNTQFVWTDNGLFAIEKGGWQITVTNLSTGGKLINMGTLEAISPSCFKVIFSTSSCSPTNLESPCDRKTWYLSSFQFQTPKEIMASKKTEVNKIIFSADEASMVYMIDNNLYLLKL